MREIHIVKAMNGFIVHVGCQTLVFNERSDLIGELDRYLENPQQVEKEYQEKYGPFNPVDITEPPQANNYLTIGRNSSVTAQA